MDELVHHCLREIAFDGALGCNVSRLRDFIADFYRASSGSPQNVDDEFCAFIWSLLAQQPTVRVGTVPEGVTSGVWIAPQVSAKRKANDRGEDFITSTPSELVPIADSQTTALGDLKHQLGDNLRVALDPDAIYAAVTGSHIRYGKLSPMVYSALQIITRGRDKGVTVIELGQQTKYDQKTCFYLVKQLMELDLCVKVRQAGSATHCVLHKYFFDRSPTWKALREEEATAQNANVNVAVDEEAEEDNHPEVNDLHFSPIDSRHLSSIPLLRARVIRLLKGSTNQMQPTNRVLTSIGFSSPTKSDRRYFYTTMKAFIDEGVVDRVLVASKRSKGSNIICFRLLNENGAQSVDGPGSISATNDEIESSFDAGMAGGVKMNVTLPKQLIDLLEESGTTGMTLTELSTALGDFDRRTIELLLTRAEKAPPPPHLADIGVADAMETNGRERRHRYYTIAHYRTLVEQEKLDQSTAGYGTVDLSAAKGFLELETEMFYETEKELRKYHDNFLERGGLAKEKKKRGRPRTTGAGVRKRKRAEESAADESGPSKKRKKSKHADEMQTRPVPKLRGRKHSLPVDGEEEDENQDVEEEDLVPRKRRRKAPSPDSDIVNGRSSRRAATPLVSEVQPSPAAATTSHKSDPRHTSVKLPGDTLGEPPPNQTRQGSPFEPPNELMAVPASPSLETPPFIDEQLYPPDPPPPSQHNPVGVPMDVDQRGSEVIPSSTTTMNGSIEMDTDITSLAQPVVTTPTVAPKDVPKPKGRGVNVSQLRRENECYRLVQELGGIVNIHTKDFYDAHLALIERLVKGGEPTSCPAGIRIDKRTVQGAFNALENKGKVKIVKSMIVAPSGQSRQTTIVQLPDTPQVKFAEYLAHLGRNLVSVPPPMAHVEKIAGTPDYGAKSTERKKRPHVAAAQDRPKLTISPDELFQQDESSIRDLLLMERTTSSQLYGSIVPKGRRVHRMHTIALSAIERRDNSPNIVSFDHQIFALDFFTFDIPLAEYSGILASLQHDPMLTDFFSKSHGKETLVKDLPTSLHTSLQIGRSRARSRLLELLEVMGGLKLAIPLAISTSEDPMVRCTSSDGHTWAFDPAKWEGWTASTPQVAPTYWMFEKSVPLYHLASIQESAPFMRQLPLGSLQEASIYWALLQEACLNMKLTPNSDETVASVDPKIRRALCRPAAWASSYSFTFHQSTYLSRFVDYTNHTTPLDDDDDGDARIKRLSWVTSAPEEEIRTFFNKLIARIEKELQKARRKEQQELENTRAKEAKASLALRAAEERMKKESDFAALLSAVQSEPLSEAAEVRIRRVKKHYLDSVAGPSSERWEKEIQDALKEAAAASKQVLTNRKKTHPSKPRARTTFNAFASSNEAERTVEDLISSQPPLDPPVSKKKKSKKAADTEAGPSKQSSARRSRFQWNKELDDLARDAYVIIKARARSCKRIEWAAYEQVFPNVPRNSVRQRLGTLKEIPGAEAYLVRLEEMWYDLWVTHRGSESLPDEEPDSLTEFDLVNHIKFLRSKIDKKQVRVGYGAAQERQQYQTLPATLESLHANFDVIEQHNTTPAYDFLWQGLVEDAREKKFLSTPFTAEAVFSDPPSEVPSMVSVAESALKMVMGTPQSSYTPEAGASFLRCTSEELVQTATRNLLGRQVLSKLVRDVTKQRPGRQLKISDMNQNSLGGLLPEDVFTDASTLEEAFSHHEDWREWPLTSSDGDTAGLLQLAAEGKVDFKVDVSSVIAACASLDWNSKKSDDDHIETSIFVRFDQLALDDQAGPLGEDTDSPSNPPTVAMLDTEAERDDTVIPQVNTHGTTVEGAPACCRILTDGVIDCTTCLDEQWVTISETFTPEELQVAQHVLWIVGQAQEQGVARNFLVESTGLEWVHVGPVVRRMTDSAIPLLNWMGYSHALHLVSSSHIHRWSVVVCEEPMTRIFPRRWIDIRGARIPDVWAAGLRAVTGLIIFRPGISQSELHWRLKAVYDRAELNDLLRHLLDEGYLKLLDVSGQESMTEVFEMDDKDEKYVFWFLSESRHWYQVSH